MESQQYNWISVCERRMPGTNKNVYSIKLQILKRDQRLRSCFYFDLRINIPFIFSYNKTFVHDFAHTKLSLEMLYIFFFE